MLGHLREDYLQEVLWNDYPRSRNASDAVSVFECWKVKGEDAARHNVNWRFLNLYREQRRGEQQFGPNEQMLQKWLKWEDTYAPLKPSDQNEAVLGGIRLVFCERRNLFPGMTLSEHAFFMVEKAFDLHATTLPTFSAEDGSYAIFQKSSSAVGPADSRIHFVAKAYQKVEIMNCTLSLSHNVSTGWTTAFICGEGILLDEYSDLLPQVQRWQFLQSILGNHASWDNPLLLPFALLETSTRRMEVRSHQISDELTELEVEIGVTVAGSAHDKGKRDRWPEDINTRKVTKDLHSELTQTIFLLSFCDWTRGYGAWLLKAIDQVSSHPGVQGRQIDFASMQEHIEYLNTTFSRVNARVMASRDRSNLQINMLFTIINQQAAITSRRDADLSLQVAKSSKQDAISVNTFTAITALFLPGSFVATMFSMSMFNWQADTNTDSSTPPTTTTNNGTRYVVDVYWIFWVVTFPLTALTFIIWKLYSDYANRKWLRQLETHKTVEPEPRKEP